MHPWNYSENWNNQIGRIKDLARLNNFVAIGETGFDSKSPVSIEVQKDIFKKHIVISEETKKPMIIHCVKFFNELIQLKKEVKPRQALIIHGFRSKVSIAEDLIKHDFYFSLNEGLLQDQDKAKQLLLTIGLEHLFFETDDLSTDIKNIYNFASKVFDISLEKLNQEIEKNLIKCRI
ncbi:MAG: hydrolase TatD [Marinilabiliales bacterium]|nr:MAG: hydrolase TatD [Marinilabiliales bacterium]